MKKTKTMKKVLIVPAMALAMFACQNQATNNEGSESMDANREVESTTPQMAYFGAEVSKDGAISIEEARTQLGEMDSVDLKVTGTVAKVCQVKGCWMTMDYGEEESMHVSFRDYGFFVPKNIDGKEAVIDGTLYMETTSVEDLQHYAEDEGKSEEEIAAITEPETRLTFVADGVIVKDYEVEVGSAKEEEMHPDHKHGEGSDHDHDHEDEHSH